MKILAILASLLFTVNVSAADRLPTMAQADRNLKTAQQSMWRAFVALQAQLTPVQNMALTADQGEWNKRVEAWCTPESDGLANAGSAAVLEYTIETQCTADATLDRARRIREAMVR